MFIDSLGEKDQQKVLACVKLLEDKGVTLHRPHADFLRDGIYELRVKTSQLCCRVLYFFNRNQIVLTHGFKKKARKVPKPQIDRAVKYKKDWEQRNMA